MLRRSRCVQIFLSKKQDDTLILRFIEKGNDRDLEGENTMNCKQATEKQLGASSSEIGDNTSSSEKAVSSVCHIKIKIWATVVASDTINLKNYKKMVESNRVWSKKHKSFTGSDVAGFLRSVLNIPQNVTSTRWAFKVKPDRSSKARQAVLGWRQKYSNDCGIIFACRFDSLVIASTKRANIPDVQNILLSWILDKNELKSTTHFSKLYRVK